MTALGLVLLVLGGGVIGVCIGTLWMDHPDLPPAVRRGADLVLIWLIAFHLGLVALIAWGMG